MMADNRKVYLMDSNTFIAPFKMYYPFDFAPSFWDFLGSNISDGKIVVLKKVYDEVAKGTDDLSVWIEGLGLATIDHRTPEILGQ